MKIDPQSDAEHSSAFLSAYHEAGHAALALISKYHLPLRVQLLSISEGRTDVTLSKEKLSQCGKLSGSIAKDSDVALEEAVIHFAGRYAEEVFAARERSKGAAVYADATGWRDDEVKAMDALSRVSWRYCAVLRARRNARSLIKENWGLVSRLAEALIASPDCDLLATDLDPLRKKKKKGSVLDIGK
jgi:hypothetical protein